MAPQALVESEIEVGRALVEALDKAGLPVSIAMWYFDEEGGEYRFILAAPFVEKLGKRKAYLKLAVELERANLDEKLPLRRIEALHSDEPLATSVRKYVHSPANTIVGTRITGSYIEGVWIPDAYVYRAA